MYATLRRRWPLTVLVLVAAVVLATTVAVVALERESPAAAAAATTSRPPASAIFTDSCRLTRVANDDPLLDPGRPGVSMQHDFFGNTGVTASSTAGSLVGGATTCSTGADASAYWTPVLSQDGRALTPLRTLIYWRTPGADAATTRPMPAGISMIAGDEDAGSPQGSGVIRWDCEAGGVASRSSDTPQSCAAGGQLRLVVTFPSCWDGRSLGGATQTNVVYPVGNACPVSHPVRIPTIVFHETYPTASAAGLTLSMGPGMQGSTDTAHADFVDGWTQSAFDRAFATCVTGGRACGEVSGPAATPAHPQDLTPPRRATRHTAVRRAAV